MKRVPPRIIEELRDSFHSVRSTSPARVADLAKVRPFQLSTTPSTAAGLQRGCFITLTKLSKEPLKPNRQKGQQATTEKALPDILCKRQSLSLFTPFGRFGADLRTFRFNPRFSRSRLVAMVTEISFTRRRTKAVPSTLSAGRRVTRMPSVETSTSRFMERSRTMKTLRWAIASSLVGVLFAGTAMAQATMSPSGATA